MTNFLYIDRKGQRHGPVAPEDLRQLFRAGDIHRDTPVWRPGMSDWVPVRTLLQLPPARPPARPAAPRSAAKASPLPWILLAVGGGVFLLAGGVVAVCLIASGGNNASPGGQGSSGGGGGAANPAPKQLAGNWAGQVIPDFSKSPELAQLAAPNAMQGIRFDFQCTDDGKLKWGMGGVIVPFEMHAGMIKQQLFMVNPNKKAILTEFVTTVDTCRFSIYEVRERDVEWGGPGTDLIVTGRRVSQLTVVARRVGDEVEVELSVKEGTGGGPLQESPVSLKGRLRRN